MHRVQRRFRRRPDGRARASVVRSAAGGQTVLMMSSQQHSCLPSNGGPIAVPSAGHRSRLLLPDESQSAAAIWAERKSIFGAVPGTCGFRHMKRTGNGERAYQDLRPGSRTVQFMDGTVRRTTSDHCTGRSGTPGQSGGKIAERPNWLRTTAVRVLNSTRYSPGMPFVNRSIQEARVSSGIGCFRCFKDVRRATQGDGPASG